MTEKQVKAYLSKAKGIKVTIRNLEDVINRNNILATCYGAIQANDKVQSSPRLDARYTELVEEKSDAQAELKNIVQKYNDTIIKIIEVIHSLEDNEQIEVLMYKYVEGLGFYHVYKKAHMSKSKMYRVHDRAISELAKKWETLGIDK